MRAHSITTRLACRNTASSVDALPDNYIGNKNTADGTTALFLNTTGSNNTASGDSALFNNTTGINNAAFGAGAGSGVTMADNVICIGANVAGADVSNACFIGNIRDLQTQNADAIPVLIDSAGHLGPASSSAEESKEAPMSIVTPAVQSVALVQHLKAVRYLTFGEFLRDSMCSSCEG